MPRKNFRNDKERLREVARIWRDPVAEPDAPTGRPWSNQLSNEEYMSLLSADCFYCGDSLGLNYIEPIDESKPVHSKNSIAKCYECQRLKGDRTREQFREHAGRQ